MKKIYNSVPLQTIWYTLSGFQRIKIRNFEPGQGLWHSNEPDEVIEKSDYCKVVFDGIAKNLDEFTYTLLLYSKVHGIKAVGDVIVIDICTKADEYV